MRRRETPKGSRKEGTPVPKTFVCDNLSYANCIPYERPTLLKKALQEAQPDKFGFSWNSDFEYYKYKMTYGGASTFKRGETFGKE